MHKSPDKRFFRSLIHATLSTCNGCQAKIAAIMAQHQSRKEAVAAGVSPAGEPARLARRNMNPKSHESLSIGPRLAKEYAWIFSALSPTEAVAAGCFAKRT